MDPFSVAFTIVLFGLGYLAFFSAWSIDRKHEKRGRDFFHSMFSNVSDLV